MNPRDRPLAFACALGLIFSLGAPPAALAQEEEQLFEEEQGGDGGDADVLETSTGRLLVQGAFGAAIPLDWIAAAGTQLKFGAEATYHLLSEDSTGLAVGGGLHLSAIDFEVLQVFARAAWDFEIVPGILASPHVDVGLAALFLPFNDQTAFDFGFGADVRFDFGGFYAFVRPAHIDIFAAEGEALIRYDFLVGAGGALL